MPDVIRLCIDALRVFSDAKHDPAPEKRPRSGPGKGNEHTERAIKHIENMTRNLERASVPTYWVYMDNDPVFTKTLLSIDESGGGLHPSLKAAFPNYAEMSLPKYGQSIFSHMISTRTIVEAKPKALIYSGFLASECVKDSACDMEVFYDKRPLANVMRIVASDCVGETEDQSLVKKGLDTMERNGCLIMPKAQIPSFLKARGLA